MKLREVERMNGDTKVILQEVNNSLEGEFHFWI